MSQADGMPGDGFSVDRQKTASSGRAILLLALAVVISVMLLQSLDNASATDTEETAPPAEEVAAPAPVDEAAPVLPMRAPSDVRVLVANGTDVSGAASGVAGRLQRIGYQLGTPGNTAIPQATSAVQFMPGFQAEAQALATSLNLPATAVQPITNPAPLNDLQNSNIVVILGNELASAAPGAGGASQSGASQSTQSQAGQPQAGQSQSQTQSGNGNSQSSSSGGAGAQQAPANPTVDGPLGAGNTTQAPIVR